MIENYGSIYYNNDEIKIHNAWELAEFQKKYSIFKDQNILDLIKFIDNPVIKDLKDGEYFDISKEINKKYESVLFAISDLPSIINWALVPNEWATKKITIKCGSLISKSVEITPIFSRLPPFFSVTGKRLE